MGKCGGTDSWTKRLTRDKTSGKLFWAERKGLYYVERKGLLSFEGVKEGLMSYDLEMQLI